MMLQFSLELMTTIVFGRHTVAITQFISEFLRFWHIVRQPTTNFTTEQHNTRSHLLENGEFELFMLMCELFTTRIC